MGGGHTARHARSARTQVLPPPPQHEGGGGQAAGRKTGSVRNHLSYPVPCTTESKTVDVGSCLSVKMTKWVSGNSLFNKLALHKSHPKEWFDAFQYTDYTKY